MTKLTLHKLESHLLKIADEVRGKMDASEFKEFIFGMLIQSRRNLAGQGDNGRTGLFPFTHPYFSHFHPQWNDNVKRI